MKADGKSHVMRVEVDRHRCFSHARCIAIAPEIFSLDDQAISIVGDIRLARLDFEWPERGSGR